MPGLAVSDVVNVTVSLTPTGLALQNFGTLLIVGSSEVIDATQRYRQYSTLAQVGSDFAGNAPEYLAASLFFGQTPQPAILYIGRWAQAATPGRLYSGVFSGAQQATLLAALASVTTGSMQMTVAGVLKTLSALNFSAATTMSAVAAVINTALGASAGCTWLASSGQFQVKATATGTTSTMTFASATGSGTDVSTTLAFTAVAGASTVTGVSAETALASAQALVNLTNAFYGLTYAVAGGAMVNADHLAIAGYVEGLAPRRLYVVTTQDANALSPTSTTDLAYVLSAGLFQHTFTFYSSASPYAAVGLFAKFATVDYTGSDTAITGKFQTLAGLVAETLTETQASALKAKNSNVFVNYSNTPLTPIVQEGVVANGYFIDEITGTDWLQNAIRTAIFNTLLTVGTKVPQTDAGINLLVNAIDAQLVQAVTNGLVGPGVWQGPSIGVLTTGQNLNKGWYVFVQPLALQSYATRVARQAPLIQIAIVLAGAVHFANVQVNVTR